MKPRLPITLPWIILAVFLACLLATIVRRTQPSPEAEQRMWNDAAETVNAAPLK